MCIRQDTLYDSLPSGGCNGWTVHGLSVVGYSKSQANDQACRLTHQNKAEDAE